MKCHLLFCSFAPLLRSDMYYKTYFVQRDGIYRAQIVQKSIHQLVSLAHFMTSTTFSFLIGQNLDNLQMPKDLVLVLKWVKILYIFHLSDFVATNTFFAPKGATCFMATFEDCGEKRQLTPDINLHLALFQPKYGLSRFKQTGGIFNFLFNYKMKYLKYET